VHLGHGEEVLVILVGGTDQNRDVPGVVRTAGGVEECSWLSSFG
jgi:hypothetical protein